MFHKPTDIAASEDCVYVCDLYANRIQVFDSYGTPLATFGGLGRGDGQFFRPYGIAVDEDGNVYVANAANNRIQKFAADGTFLTKWGTQGSGDGQFYNPYGIAVDGSGNVYVADSDNHRIQKFALNYPSPDPDNGLALNGSFEKTPDLVQ